MGLWDVNSSLSCIEWSTDFPNSFVCLVDCSCLVILTHWCESQRDEAVFWCKNNGNQHESQQTPHPKIPNTGSRYGRQRQKRLKEKAAARREFIAPSFVSVRTRVCLRVAFPAALRVGYKNITIARLRNVGLIHKQNFEEYYFSRSLFLFTGLILTPHTSDAVSAMLEPVNCYNVHRQGFDRAIFLVPSKEIFTSWFQRSQVSFLMFDFRS